MEVQRAEHSQNNLNKEEKMLVDFYFLILTLNMKPY